MLNKSDIEYIKKEYNKIRNLYLAGQYKEVIQKTKVLLKKDPFQATFFNYIALSYSSLRKIDVAKKYCDRLIGLSDGKVVFDGVPDDLTTEISIELYDIDNE